MRVVGTVGEDVVGAVGLLVLVALVALVAEQVLVVGVAAVLLEAGLEASFGDGSFWSDIVDCRGLMLGLLCFSAL